MWIVKWEGQGVGTQLEVLCMMLRYGTCTYGSCSDHTHVHTPATFVQDSKLSLQMVGFHDPSSLGGLALYPGFPLFSVVECLGTRWGQILMIHLQCATIVQMYVYIFNLHSLRCEATELYLSCRLRLPTFCSIGVPTMGAPGWGFLTVRCPSPSRRRWSAAGRSSSRSRRAWRSRRRRGGGRGWGRRRGRERRRRVIAGRVSTITLT